MTAEPPGSRWHPPTGPYVDPKSDPSPAGSPAAGPQIVHMQVNISGEMRDVKVTIHRGSNTPDLARKVEQLANAFKLGQDSSKYGTTTKIHVGDGQIIREGTSGNKTYSINDEKQRVARYQGNQPKLDKLLRTYQTFYSTFPELPTTSPAHPNSPAARAAVPPYSPGPTAAVDSVVSRDVDIVDSGETVSLPEDREGAVVDAGVIGWRPPLPPRVPVQPLTASVTAEVEEELSETDETSVIDETEISGRDEVKHQNILIEMRETEKNFSQALEKIVDFREQIAGLAEQNEDVRKLYTLLEVVNVIRNDSEVLQDKLSNEGADTAVIMQLFSLEPEAFYTYTTNSKDIQELTARLERTSSEFNSILQNFVEEKGLNKIGDILITPAQRYPRYVMYLNDLCKIDKGKYAPALANCVEVADRINEGIRSKEIVQRLINDLSVDHELGHDKNGHLIKVRRSSIRLFRRKDPEGNVRVVNDLISKLQYLLDHGAFEQRELANLRNNKWLNKVLNEQEGLRSQFDALFSGIQA